MAGHSHWAGIKRKKAVADAKRGQLFSKLARQIMVAARLGGRPDTVGRWIKLRRPPGPAMSAVARELGYPNLASFLLGERVLSGQAA